MTDAEGNPTPKSSESDPPAMNQPHDAGVPTTPDESAQAGSPDADPAGTPQSDDDGGSGSGGDLGDVKESAESGIPAPVAAPPGKPDGEVDTRA